MNYRPAYSPNYPPMPYGRGLVGYDPRYGDRRFSFEPTDPTPPTDPTNPNPPWTPPPAAPPPWEPPSPGDPPPGAPPPAEPPIGPAPGAPLEYWSPGSGRDPNGPTEGLPGTTADWGTDSGRDRHAPTEGDPGGTANWGTDSGRAPADRPSAPNPTDRYGWDYAWRLATGQGPWAHPPVIQDAATPNWAPGSGRDHTAMGQGDLRTGALPAGSLGYFGSVPNGGAPPAAVPAVVVPPAIQAERDQRRPPEPPAVVKPPRPVAPLPPVQPAAPRGATTALGVSSPAAPVVQPFQQTAQPTIYAAPQPGRLPNGNVGY